MKNRYKRNYAFKYNKKLRAYCFVKPTDFSGVVDFRGEYLEHSHLVNFDATDFRGCVLYNCFPSGVEGAIEVNPVTLTKDRWWNHSFYVVDSLKGADLERRDMSRANLEGADLEGANLRYTNLEGSNLRGANLKNADLSNADLTEVDLAYADLEGAELEMACYGESTLLTGANITTTQLDSMLSTCPIVEED